MKLRCTIALAALFSLAGCDQIKEAISKSGEEAPTASAGAAKAKAKELTEAQYPSFIATRNQVMVVDFHATWCGPCKTLAPKLAEVVGEFGSKVALGKVDVDQANALAAKLQVSSIPDVRIYVDGRQVDRFLGDIPADQIRAKLKAHADGISGVPELAPVGEEGGQTESSGPVIQPMQKDWLPPGMQKK